jgi:hypothetical protein
LGDEHAPHAPPSNRHSNVEPASVAVNEKLAELDPVGSSGADVIDVSGGPVSTVNA